MRAQRIWPWLVAILLAGAAIAFLALPQEPGSRRPVTRSSAAAPVILPIPQRAAPAEDAVKTVPEPPIAAAGLAQTGMARRARWLRDMGRGDNLRPLFDDALAHPEEGGRLYALEMLLRCREQQLLREHAATQPAPDVNHPNYAQYLRTIERWSLMCNQLGAHDGGDEAIARLLADADALQHDPWLRQSLGLLEAEDPAERRRLLGELLARYDPIAGQSLLASVDEHGGVWFKGRHLRLPEDGAAVQAAASALPLYYAHTLAQCAFGDSCGRNDPGIAAACLQDQRYCGADSRELLVRQMIADEGHGADMLQQVYAYRDAIVQAIRERDVEAFMPPR